MLTKLLKNNEFIKNTFTLVVGTIVAQIIPLLIMPVLTRIYTPDDFGNYALFMSVVGVLSVVATARYEVAIMLPRLTKDSLNLLYISIVIAAFVSAALFFIILIGSEWFKKYLDFKVLILIPVLVFAMAVLKSLNIWLNRNKNYKRMSVNNIEKSLYIGVNQLVFVLINNLSFGLIYGQIVGQLITTASLFKYCKDDLLNFNYNKARNCILFKKYFYLIKYGLPALLTSRVAQESLVFLVATFMGSVILGLVSIIQRVVGIPGSVIASNLGSVFYEKIYKYKKEKSYPLIKKYILILTCISIPVYLIYYFVFKLLFVFVFGVGWVEALDYAPYFFIVAAFSFIFSPITILFNYYEVQGWNLIWQSAWLASNVIVFSISGVYAFTSSFTFLIYSISQSLIYLFGIVSFLIYAKRIYEK
jgi:O-antigen/teichoic acid export membrane protein